MNSKMRSYALPVLCLLLLNGLIGCSLSADQEKALSYQTGLYLSAIRSKSVLSTVSMTHPDYVRYAQSKGDEYFRNSFAFSGDETDLMFMDLSLEKVKSEGNLIQVEYLVKRESILHGENTQKEFRFVALSEDYGKHWFFLRSGVYRNKQICTRIKRLLD